MLHRLAIVATLILLEFSSGGNAVRAESTAIFPAEPVGDLYCAPASRVYYGADVHVEGLVTEWVFFAAAAGKVQIPAGKHVQLRLRG